MDLPTHLLEQELKMLVLGIDEEIRKAKRTIRPVRLILSIDAFTLLLGGDKLSQMTSDPNGRPTYKGLICHPSVFPDTDINPYQYFILG